MAPGATPLRFGAVDGTGAPKEMVQAESGLLANGGPVVRGAIHESGLWRVQGAFNSTDVLLVLMVGTLAWVNPMDIFSDYGPFMTLAANDSLSPTVDMIMQWFQDMADPGVVAVPLVWHVNASDGQKRRIAGKVIHLLCALLVHLRSQRDQNNGIDADLPAAIHSSSATEWRRCYSEQPVLSDVPNMKIMGSIHNGVVNRRLPLIELRKCTAADEVPSSSLAQLVADKSTGTVSYKQMEKTTSLGHPQKFVKALSLLMNGFAFVCITIMADVAHWSGEALHGVVRGTRRLFARTDGDQYLKYWTEVAFSGIDLPKIVELEAKCRRMWADPFMNMVRLGCCLRASLTEIKGEVAAALAAKQFQKKMTGVGGGHPRPNDITNNTPEKKSRKEIAASKPGFREEGTALETADGRKICKFWVDGRGCNYGDKCNKVHNYCDWVIDGKVCGGPHKRSEHQW